MDSEIIRAVQKDKQLTTKRELTFPLQVPTTASKISPKRQIKDDLYAEVLSSLHDEFSDPIVAPHWWSKPADDLKGFMVKTRINNTIWRQWYVHFMMGKKTLIEFANPIPLADKYHSRNLAVVVEGHYWCRKLRSIRMQYNAWRKSTKPTATKIKPTKKKNLTNLITGTKSEESWNRDVTSFASNDLVFSGLLQEFDFQHLDCKHHDNMNADFNFDFDLSSLTACTDLTMPETSEHMPVINPLEAPLPGNNQQRPELNDYHVSEALPLTDEKEPDTSSLNTLATAATQYYPRETHHAHFNNDYNNNPPPDTRTENFPDTIGLMQRVEPPDTRYNVTLSNNYHNMPPPKGPAYYPPTRLQYCYSVPPNTPKLPHYIPQHIPPISSHYQTLDHYPPVQHEPQSSPKFLKQKVSELEIDRKRRRVMKDRLHNLRKAIPSASKNGGKTSHATLLNQAASYLHNEEKVLKDLESQILKFNSAIEQTREQIATHQRQIPENGISAACFGSSIIDQEYRNFVMQHTTTNPLMKVYSFLFEPLFTSFNSMVDNTSLDSFCKTSHRWFSQNCSLEKLRELATNLVTRPDLEFKEEGL